MFVYESVRREKYRLHRLLPKYALLSIKSIKLYPNRNIDFY
jgi:hypothetical protein